MSKKKVKVPLCEACGSQVNFESDYGTDGDGLLFCAECAEDARNDKKPRCREQFQGRPFKPGRPIRVFICQRAKGHTGLHAVSFSAVEEGKFATVRWSPDV